MIELKACTKAFFKGLQAARRLASRVAQAFLSPFGSALHRGSGIRLAPRPPARIGERALASLLRRVRSQLGSRRAHHYRMHFMLGRGGRISGLY